MRLCYLQFYSFYFRIVFDILLFQRKDAPQIRRLTTVIIQPDITNSLKSEHSDFGTTTDTVYFHCELLACHRNYPDSRLVSNYSVTLQTSQSELPQLDFRELMILLGVTAKCLCRFCFFLFGCYQIREMLPQEISHLICVV